MAKANSNLKEDSITLVDAENNLMQAHHILSFLTGITPHPGTVMGENEEHGNQLVLFQVMGLLRDARSAVEYAREVKS